jgi:hypothetical protein
MKVFQASLLELRSRPLIESIHAILPLVIASVSLVLLPAAAAAPDFRFADVNDKSLGLWEGEKPVLVYNHGIISRPDVRGARDRSCYIHPLHGLDGEILTDDYPQDHVYHRGLYWAWSHITLDGKEYSSWDLRGVRPEFRRWLARETGRESALLGAESVWIVEGNRAVMREEILFRVNRTTAQGRAIDIEATWTPLDRPVTLRGATDKGYGGLTLRFAPRTETILTLPGGRSPEDTVMTRHAWTDYSGHFPGAPGASGAAIFIHPKHPDFPLQWVNRHYGMVAAGWPGTTPRTLETGEPVTCRYRIWIHRGTPGVPEVQREYDVFKEATP